jgi:HTH-type transcriptional regulator / antitoxin HigA
MDIHPIKNDRDQARALKRVDPIDAILFRLDQLGLTRADLVRIIGSRSRVSEVLNRRRDLTIAMIARIRDELGISADTLIGRQRAA